MKRSILSLGTGNTLRCVALAAACLTWACTPVFAQFRPAHRQELPDFDNRVPLAPKPERLSERQAGQSLLAGQLPSAVVDFDPLLDSPKFIRSRDGFLTGPNGQGRAISSLAAKAIPAGDPYEPIKAFLDEHSALFGHGAEILATARVKRDYVNANNGLHTVAWEQQFEGIPVFQSTLLAHITKNGELTSLSSRFLPDLATAADNGTPGRVAMQSAPPVTAPGAILLAGQNVGAGLTSARVLAAGGPVGDYLLFKTPEQASVRLVWFPLHRSALRLAWEVLVTKSTTHEFFQLIIDAQSGQVHLRKDLTCHISDATYSVYDSYSPSPFGPSLQVPGTFQPPLTNRNTIITPALDTTASPDGWIPDGSNTTTGNNIDAFLDRNGDEQPDQPRPQGNPNRVFNFPLDLTLDPTNYIDASTVQLFWRANWYHDRLYQLGFTEAAGNYQDNTFGRGGLGNDHIICFVQSGADVGQTDNSMFAPAPDGQNGRCYMFIFTGTNPNRDGSLDQEVVTHELTHGTSWRLVGGGGMVLGSLQGDGMGEGWSDFYAETLLNPAGADPDAAYASGGYASYLLAGTGYNQNYYFGIRRYPYCTDMTKNPLTFKDIDPGQALAHKGVPLNPLFSPFDPRGADEVHNQGEVWCVTLWEMHANLVHKYGWAIGNELTLQLTTDGMKLTPGLPNFLQARDAIILADSIDNGGANLAEIWGAFAKRGMGFSATSPDGSTTAGVHESYDVPIINTLALSLDHFEISGGNGNGTIDFNECNNLNLIITNRGPTAVTGVSGTLTTTTPEVAIAQTVSSYADIPAGATGTNSLSFKISTSPLFVCGTPIDLTLVIRCGQGLAVFPFSVPTGVPGIPLRFDNNVPVLIPSPGAASSPILVSNVNSAVNNVTVSMYVSESFDFALKLELIAPDGTTNLLSANNGLLGANYGIDCRDSSRTTFDDAALTPIGSGTAPFIGSFKPDRPLSIFTGKSGTNVNGVWQLRATDQGQFEIGSIVCWSLFITPNLCTDGGGECPGADLTVATTALPDPVISGNNLTYRIAVTNNGPSTVTNVTVTQLLPDSVLFVSALSSQGTFSQAGGVITFNLGRLGPVARATMTVVALPTAAGTVFSTATVNSEQPDFTPGNNSTTVATRVSPPTADLAVALAAAPSPTLVGSTLTYTVSVTNNGPSRASGITVTNALPANATILSVTGTRGSFTTVGQVVFWNLSGLNVRDGATATVAVTPTVEGTITATATAAATQFDPIAGNNTATIDTVVGPSADLAVGITGYPNPVVAGSNVLYTIVATNFGPSVATGVILNDSLPPGVNVLSTNATQGTISISSGTLIWNLGTLPAGANATLTFVAGTTANGTLGTTATIIAAQGDPNPANNTATATTVVAAPFVRVVPAGASLTYESGPTNGAIDIGETVTLSLRLRNAGNSGGQNLVATLLATNGVVPVPPNTPQAYDPLLPSGPAVGRLFSFTATGTNGGAITAVLQLQDGTTTTYPPATFAFALPYTRMFANTNTILIPDPAAPNPPYPLDSGPAQPYPSAITISNFSGLIGKVTVTLSNLSHSFPGDINALLVAPGGANTLLMSHAGDSPVSGLDLTFDDSAPSPVPDSGVLLSGTWQPTAYSPDPRLGGFPTNAPAGPYPAQLAALNAVNANGAWSLYVFDDNSGDAGSISNGWSLALTTISPVNQLADLGLTAVATPNPALAGTTLTNVFTITNAGPNTATFVSFTNVLPAGVTLVSSSPSQGSVLTTPASVIASLGTLDAGAIATVTNVVAVTAAPIPPGLTNAALAITANVAADEGDPNPVNNTLTIAATINRPVADLALAQVVAPDPVPVGYSLTNAVTIANRGPGAALNAVLTQLLPPGVGFIAAGSSSTVGTISSANGSVSCTLGDLASNATATVTFVLTNSAPGLMTNTVTLSTDSYDPAPANNRATYVATVVSPAPQIINAGAALTYESGPVNGAVDPGETVTLSLALANIGSLDTANLQATLLPSGGVTSPSGPQFYGALIHGGPSTARSFTFTSGSVPGGATVATLQLQDAANTYPPVTITFASPAETNFSRSAAISIPDHGTATPYPATINVSGVAGRINKATVTLNKLTHSFPHDINVVLVSPAGTNVLVMSHTGGGHAVTNINLTFDDAATATLPNNDPITAGTYQPSSYEGTVALPGTAPTKSYQYALSALKWNNPNGVWSLYVFDDTVGDDGIIAGGWSLGLTTLVTVGPVMDLAVSTVVPAALNVGEALTNTITITNAGPDSATGVVLTNTLPAGVTFVSASLSQGSFTGASGGQVTCSLGSLAAGASATVIIVTVPSVTGSLLNAVSVAGSGEDLNPANNSAQAKTAVDAPAILSGFVSDGHFHLTVTAAQGYVYVVQGSTNLTSWVSLSTNTNTTGTFSFIDTTTPAPESRFYRTVRQ